MSSEEKPGCLFQLTNVLNNVLNLQLWDEGVARPWPCRGSKLRDIQESKENFRARWNSRQSCIVLETIAYFFGSECPRTINRGDAVKILLYWVTCNSELWIPRVLVVSLRKVIGIDVVEGAETFCSPIPLYPFPPLPRTSFTAPQVAEVYWRCLNSSTVTVSLGNSKGRDNANPNDMKRKWDFFLSFAFFSD